LVARSQEILEGRSADLQKIFLTGQDSEIIAALLAFVDRYHVTDIDARPVRDGAGQMEQLLNSDGPRAVRTLATWLRDCLLAKNTDGQLLSALAFAAAQCTTRFPDQVAMALFGSGKLASSQNAPTEQLVWDQAHSVIRLAPTSLVGSSLLTLCARFGPIHDAAVLSLLNASLCVDPISERRLDNMLHQIRGVGESTITILEEALSSQSSRKRRVAIRLLGAFLRTPGNSGESLRTATSLLTRYAYTEEGKLMPFGIASRSESGEGAFYFRHDSLSEIALRELRRRW
jgi:hypothetical protein